MPLWKGPARTSAALAAQLSDETGTGAAVFGTSPGFTTAANPASSDGASLGTTALMWADAFLAAGGVVNFNNGAVTLNHVNDAGTYQDALKIENDDLYALVCKSSNTIGTSLILQNTSTGAYDFEFFVTGQNNSPGFFGVYSSTGNIAPLAISGSTGDFKLMSGSAFTWTNNATSASDGTSDTGLSRSAAAVVAVGNGTAGDTSGQLRLSMMKVGGTATRGTTEGTNQVVIFNGTAPAGTLTNGASFFADTGEMRVMDSAGNNTLLSPHDRDTNEWIFDSVDTRTGKRLRIDVERLLRTLNDRFGLDYVHDLMAEE